MDSYNRGYGAVIFGLTENGQTGLAGEPQLHFEIRKNRVPLDPAKYLPKVKAAAPPKAAVKPVKP